MMRSVARRFRPGRGEARSSSMGVGAPNRTHAGPRMSWVFQMAAGTTVTSGYRAR